MAPPLLTLDDEPIIPRRESQARMLADAGVAQFEYRDEPLPQGGIAHAPVRVANPDELRKVWGGIAAKYKEAFERAKEKKPKLSTTFIAKHLPAQYRSKLPRHIVSAPKSAPTANRVIRAAGKLTDAINGSRLGDLEKFKQLAAKEAWDSDALNQVRAAMKEVESAIASARDSLSRVRL